MLVARFLFARFPPYILHPKVKNVRYMDVLVRAIGISINSMAYGAPNDFEAFSVKKYYFALKSTLACHSRKKTEAIGWGSNVIVPLSSASICNVVDRFLTHEKQADRSLSS